MSRTLSSVVLALILLAAVAAVALATGARADTISAAPEAVNVTVYRFGAVQASAQAVDRGDTSGLALIVETRTVELPAGTSRIRFQGVADGMIASSAGLSGLPGAVVERNFDYDLLGPGSLIARSVGQGVTVVRTNRRTGRETTERAVLRAGPDGVVLDYGAGRIEALGCSGEAEKLVFDRTPPDLAERPTLSVKVRAPGAGRYTLVLSYLTVRMNWRADYVARIAPDGRTLALSGWITLANRTDMSFANAPTAVVAGTLARVPVPTPADPTVTRQDACWPMGATHPGRYPAPPAPVVMDEVMPASVAMPAPPMATKSAMAGMVVAQGRQAIESQLGDYRLYQLAEPSTVAAQQTKQAAFLDQPQVAFDMVYRWTGEVDSHPDAAQAEDADEPHAATAILKFDNKAARGLGRGLPAGQVRLLLPRAAGGPPLFGGESALERDVPVGESFELRLGAASDVQITRRVTAASSVTRGGRERWRVTYEVHAMNAKGVAVVAEIRHPRDETADFHVLQETAPHGQKAGDPLWTLAVPANGERTLTYTVTYATD